MSGLPESAREAIAAAGSRCETWMQFQAADLRDGYLLDAADCAEEAAALSALAFHLARGGLL